MELSDALTLARANREAVLTTIRGNGLPQDWVRFLYEDLEGTLWAGTGAGLVSVHSSAFSILDTPDQRQGCTVTSVSPDRHGGLWVGTDGAGLYRRR